MTGLTKIIVVVLLGAGISVALVVLLVSPLLNEVTVINALAREKQTELALLQRQIVAFKTAQADLANAERKDEILEAIPMKVDIVTAIIDIENAASLANATHVLQIKEVIETSGKKPVAVISQKVTIDEIPYDLRVVTGDFNSMVNFISYLEHLPHFTELSKLTLSSERVSGEEGVTGGRSGVVSGFFNGVFFHRIQ